jgi:hypothetical protein
MKRIIIELLALDTHIKTLLNTIEKARIKRDALLKNAKKDCNPDCEYYTGVIDTDKTHCIACLIEMHSPENE